MLKSQIVRNQCLKCGAVRYEPQNFLVMCKICDCIMKDRKPDDRTLGKQLMDNFNEMKTYKFSLDASTRKDEDNLITTKDVAIKLIQHPDNSPRLRAGGRNPKTETTLAGDIHSQVSLEASSDKGGDVEGRGGRLPIPKATFTPDTHIKSFTELRKMQEEHRQDVDVEDKAK